MDSESNKALSFSVRRGLLSSQHVKGGMAFGEPYLNINIILQAKQMVVDNTTTSSGGIEHGYFGWRSLVPTSSELQYRSLISASKSKILGSGDRCT